MAMAAPACCMGTLLSRNTLLMIVASRRVQSPDWKQESLFQTGGLGQYMLSACW